MIDRELNYGREQIVALAKRCQVKGARVETILDLGAGHGNDLLNVKEYFPKAELHGIECYPEYIADLKAKGIKVHSLNLESDRLPLPDESVDLIIANQILEHTKEVFWILHESTRILRTGGHLIIGVPNLASLHNRLLLLAGRQPTCIQTASAHVRGFTLDDFSEFLQSCFPGGYTMDSWKGSNFYPFPRAVARPLAGMFPGLAYSIFMLIEKEKVYQRSFVEFPQHQKLETNYFLGM